MSLILRMLNEREQSRAPTISDLIGSFEFRRQGGVVAPAGPLPTGGLQAAPPENPELPQLEPPQPTAPVNIPDEQLTLPQFQYSPSGPELLNGEPLSSTIAPFRPSPMPVLDNRVVPSLNIRGPQEENDSNVNSLRPVSSPRRQRLWVDMLQTLGLVSNIPRGIASDLARADGIIGTGIGAGIGALRSGRGLGAAFREGVQAAREFSSYTASGRPSTEFFINRSLGGAAEAVFGDDIPNTVRALLGADFSFAAAGGVGERLSGVDSNTPSGDFNPFGLLPPEGSYTAAADLADTDVGIRAERDLLRRATRILDYPTAVIGAPLQWALNLGAIDEEDRIDIPRFSDWTADRLVQLRNDPVTAGTVYAGTVLDALLDPVEVVGSVTNLARARNLRNATAPSTISEAVQPGTSAVVSSPIPLNTPEQTANFGIPNIAPDGQLSLFGDNSAVLPDVFNNAEQLPLFETRAFNRGPRIYPPVSMPDPEYVQLDLSNIDNTTYDQLTIPFNEFTRVREGTTPADGLRNPFWFDYGGLRQRIVDGAPNQEIIEEFRGRGIRVTDEIINRVIRDDLTDEVIAEAADLPAPPSLRDVSDEITELARTSSPITIAEEVAPLFPNLTIEEVATQVIDILNERGVPEYGTLAHSQWGREGTVSPEQIQRVIEEVIDDVPNQLELDFTTLSPRQPVERLPNRFRNTRQLSLFSPNRYRVRRTVGGTEQIFESSTPVQLSIYDIPDEQLELDFASVIYGRQGGRPQPDGLRRPFWFDMTEARNRILEGATNEQVIEQFRERGVRFTDDSLNDMVRQLDEDSIARALDIDDYTARPMANDVVRVVDTEDVTIPAPRSNLYESAAPYVNDILRTGARTGLNTQQLGRWLQTKLPDLDSRDARRLVREVFRRNNVPPMGTQEYEAWARSMSDAPRVAPRVARVMESATEMHSTARQVEEVSTRSRQYSNLAPEGSLQQAAERAIDSNEAALNQNPTTVFLGTSSGFRTPRQTEIVYADPEAAQRAARAIVQRPTAEELMSRQPRVVQYEVLRPLTDEDRAYSAEEFARFEKSEFVDVMNPEGQYVSSRFIEYTPRGLARFRRGRAIYEVDRSQVRKPASRALAERAQELLRPVAEGVLPENNNPVAIALDTALVDPTLENLNRVAAQIQDELEQRHQAASTTFNEAVSTAMDEVDEVFTRQTPPVQSPPIPNIVESHPAVYERLIRENPAIRLLGTETVPRRLDREWRQFTSVATHAVRTGDPDLLVQAVTNLIEQHPRVAPPIALRNYERLRGLMREIYQQRGEWLPEEVLPDINIICDL